MLSCPAGCLFGFSSLSEQHSQNTLCDVLLLLSAVRAACGCAAAGANSGPPAGAVPTFSVTRLPELTRFLKETAPTANNLEALAAAAEPATAADSGSSSSSGADALSSIEGLDAESVALLGWSLRSGSLSSTDEDDDAVAAGALQLPLDPNSPGAPALGLDFFDFLAETGAVKTATTSFPRMGGCLY